MSYEIPNVWFAEPAKFRSGFKWPQYSDRGALVVAPERFLLYGGPGVRAFLQPRILGLERPPFSWAMLLSANVFFALYLLIPSSGGADRAHQFFTADNPMSYVAFAFCNLVSVFFALQERWVHIAYTDDAGRTQGAYFTAGTARGWARFFGGAARVLAQMNAGLESAPAGPTDPGIPTSPNPTMANTAGAQEVILVVCEECGTRTGFPARQRGTVQDCPECGTYLDVEASDGPSAEEMSHPDPGGVNEH